MTIEIKPKVLRQTSTQLRSEAKRIQACIDEVDSIIKTLGNSVFEGNRADSLRRRYSRQKPNFYNFKPFLEKFAVELDAVATRFEIADRQ